MNKKNSILLAAGTAVAVSLAFVASEKGVDLASFEKSTPAQKDFYQYTNGTWLKENPVPASEGKWGSFNIVMERNNKVLLGILENAAKDKAAPAGSPNQKLGSFFRTVMDSAKRDNEGIKPLADEMARINNIKNADELLSVAAHLQTIGVQNTINVSIEQDVKQSDRNITYLGQCKLSLPDRDYYTKDDERFKKIRSQFVEHISKMQELAGEKKAVADKIASQVLEFETNLAKVSMNRLEQRDIEAMYNKKTFAELTTQYSGIDWSKYLTEMGIKNVKELVIAQPKYLDYVNQNIKTLPLDTWKVYLKWCLLNQSANYLSTALEQQDFNFYGTVLKGTKAQKARTKRAIEAANGSVGEILGKAFVEKIFSPESKKRINEMVDNLFKAYKVRIEAVDWMTDATKKKALEKLASFTRKLGYPDKWKDYSGLEIKDDSYVQNVFRSNNFEFNYMVNKLDKPIDKTEWGMFPQTVNAYYNPLMNEIVFPAAIMQPPFFNPEADDALNYGSMGAVIGHEISHGFDDTGSKFDSQGNMVNWWMDDDKKKFDAKSQILVKQFNSYVAIDTLHVNGELTLGENIADLAGLNAAYDALQFSYQQGKEKKVIDGFTAEQRFFIGFSQVWKSNCRPETGRQLLMVDVHAPTKFRANGTLSNMPEFYNAFNVKKGDAMYREPGDRAKIW
jgi:putative endopeptidase